MVSGIVGTLQEKEKRRVGEYCIRSTQAFIISDLEFQVPVDLFFYKFCFLFGNGVTFCSRT